MTPFSRAALVLGVCALLVAMPCKAADDPAEKHADGAAVFEELFSLMSELTGPAPTGLEGLPKLEAIFRSRIRDAEWQDAIGMSPYDLGKMVRSQVAAIPGLDTNGSVLLDDPALYVEVVPLVEASSGGKPTRVFAYVALFLSEWVALDRPEIAGETVVVWGTIWREDRLVSGVRGKMAAVVQKAVTELINSFKESYLKSNPPQAKAEQK